MEPGKKKKLPKITIGELYGFRIKTDKGDYLYMVNSHDRFIGKYDYFVTDIFV